jgi:RHS repeat-associated protein
VNGSTNGPCPQWTFSTATNRISTSGFTYDQSGNLTGDGTHTYTWDGEGRLSKIDSGSTWNVTYNALGQQAERILYNSTKAEFIYNPSGQFLGGADGTAWVWDDLFVPLPGHDIGALYTGYNGAIYFPHNNALGSWNMISNGAGAVMAENIYYPWGQLWAEAGTYLGDRFGSMFDYDRNLGFGITPNRVDSTTQGRWLSPDPMGGDVSNPQSLNRYAYVMNNPMSLTDATGLQPTDCDPFMQADCPATCDAWWEVGCDEGGPPSCVFTFDCGGGGGGGGGGGAGTPAGSAGSSGTGPTTGAGTNGMGVYTGGPLSGDYGPLGGTLSLWQIFGPARRR